MLKLGISLGIVLWIVLKWQDKIAQSFSNFNFAWLIPAAIIYGVHIPAFSWRWMRLAKMLGIKLSFVEALSLSMQGLFFSLVIPGGAVGGDMVKAAVLSKRIPDGTRVEGAFTVLMDRISGMISIFALTLILLPFSAYLFKKLPVPEAFSGINYIWLMLGVASICLAGLAASCVVFAHKSLLKNKICSKLLNFGEKLSGGMLTRLTNSADTYSNNAKELTYLTIFGMIFVHLMTAFPLWFLLQGLGVDVNIFSVIVAITIGNIAGLIPLFPSGVGGRDLVIVAFLISAGVDQGVACSAQLIYTAILLAWTLLGGLFFIFDKNKKIFFDTQKQPQ